MFSQRPRWVFATLFFVLFPFRVTFALLEVGDGSDGTCNFAGNLPNRTYQCISLVINAPVNITNGTNPVRFLVLETATINAPITIIPQNGNDALVGSAFAVATAAGIASGFDGGSYEGNPPPLAHAGNGALPSNGGQASESFVAPTFLEDKGTGGGGGGGNGTSGNPGTDGSHTLGGVGGTSASWDFAQQLVGGAGGGASGAAVDGNFNSYSGATGGAGGGALVIWAQGKITIAAGGSIAVDGGDGGNGNGHSGGAGGGAGGSIELQSAAAITIAGTLSLAGGNGGNGAGNGGNGGDGGVGRVLFAAPGNTLNIDLQNAMITADAALEYGNVIIPASPRRKQSLRGTITSACSTILVTGQQASSFLFSYLLALVICLLPAIRKIAVSQCQRKNPAPRLKITIETRNNP